MLVGRAAKLEKLGLAEQLAPGQWTLKPGMEQTLRDLAIRGDIIKTMHRAMSRHEATPDTGNFALHGKAPSEPILGRLVERGLHDELQGTAYVVIEGLDGRAHHIKFANLDITGDASPGAIVETRNYPDERGRSRMSLAIRSDLTAEQQVTARGATWLDRRLLDSDPPASNAGFGAEVAAAMERRADYLVSEGLARRQAQGIVFARDLLATLRKGELGEAATRIAERTGLPHRPTGEGETIAGTYRERITLASGRFAMIDDGLGFQLVPWRPALDSRLGETVRGRIRENGIDWSFERKRDLGL